MEKIIDISGSPYLIYESENGKFSLVESIICGEETARFYFKEEEQLINGFDIRETPGRNVSLLVASAIDRHLIAIIEALKNFARISSHDYVSFTEIGGHIGRGILEHDGIGYYEVKPRLFSEKHNKFINSYHIKA